ncbi:MAG: branched-chain amino acid ABC transporter permease [Deltaproteobacteria bacterium]|jgi:branched-chain amino acid transport system permease protein|nr:branched-chain amino acid ABC transporter permease [Deltaproteobacteria bacterium]
MDLILQFCMNGLMLGMMYALVAVGFTLFFGVLDVIVFSHGDTVMIGSFAGLAMYWWLGSYYPELAVFWMTLWVLLAAVAVVALLGMLTADAMIVPLRKGPPLNTLLATMMLGTVLRESIRLFFPDGSNPQTFPGLLPDWSWQSGNLNLRFDNIVLFCSGACIIALVHLVINRTRLGMAIRAVAQDEEAAQLMGVNFRFIVLATFALGSSVAAFAGVMNGMYYNEINFGVGLLLGAIGFSSAVIGGLGNVYGAILGGFIFAFLQTIGVVVMPFASAYKDVFAFGAVILLMAWRPTGLIAEPASKRV